MSLEPEFWRRKSLAQMNQEEWEALCDGCAKCCLHKLEDEDSGELLFTSVACRYLDVQRCRCRVYDERLQKMDSCVSLSAAQVEQFRWLPASCAYRLLAEGQDLPAWHPLRSGSPRSVHAAQISVRNKAISESEVDPDQWDLYIIDYL